MAGGYRNHPAVKFNMTAIKRAGSIFPTRNFFPKATLIPTQKISADPTKERSLMTASGIKEPARAAIRVMEPW